MCAHVNMRCTESMSAWQMDNRPVLPPTRSTSASVRIRSASRPVQMFACAMSTDSGAEGAGHGWPEASVASNWMCRHACGERSVFAVTGRIAVVAAAAVRRRVFVNSRDEKVSEHKHRFSDDKEEHEQPLPPRGFLHQVGLLLLRSETRQRRDATDRTVRCNVTNHRAA